MEAVEAEIQQVVGRISASIPVMAIFLFGSAAEHEMREDSDIDLLLVMPDAQTLRNAQKTLGQIWPLASRTVEIVWLTKDIFEQKRDVGGVAYIAVHFGRQLFLRGAE
jgi:predicted nucleotidyltransferase